MSLFSRRVFGQPDSFKVLLEFGSPSLDWLDDGSSSDVGKAKGSLGSQVRLPVALVTLEFEFNNDESDAAIVERFVQRKSSLLLDRMEERVVLRITPAASQAVGGRALQSDEAVPKLIRLDLSIACRSPVLRCIQFYRVAGSGTASDSAMQMLLSHCDLSTVWKVKGAEGFGNFWATATTAAAAAKDQWSQLRNLNLSHCGLSALPPAVGAVRTLRLLRLSYNKLSSLPAELQALTGLEVLAADHNLLASIPPELRCCSSLRELNLEGNRLTTPVLDLRSLCHLQSLQVRPLEARGASRNF